MVALTSDMTQDWMMHAIYVLQEAAAKIAYTTSKRVMLEIAIIKLCKTEMRYDIEGIQARIESLEQQLAETKGTAQRAAGTSGCDGSCTAGNGRRRDSAAGSCTTNR